MRPLAILVTGAPGPAVLRRLGSFATMIRRTVGDAWSGDWTEVDCVRSEPPDLGSLSGIVVTGSAASVHRARPVDRENGGGAPASGRPRAAGGRDSFRPPNAGPCPGRERSYQTPGGVKSGRYRSSSWSPTRSSGSLAPSWSRPPMSTAWWNCQVGRACSDAPTSNRMLRSGLRRMPWVCSFTRSSRPIPCATTSKSAGIGYGKKAWIRMILASRVEETPQSAEVLRRFARWVARSSAA